MNLIEKIKNNSIDAKVKNVKSSGIPTVLYGAAFAGGLVYDFLISNGIKVDDVVIDKEFFDSLQSTQFRGHTIIEPEKLIEKYSDVNVFIGFYVNNIFPAIKKKMDFLKKNGLKVNLYMLDHHLLMDPNRVFDYSFIKENIKEFELLNDRLADDLSKNTLVAFLNQRISMQLGELDNVRVDDQYFNNGIMDFSRDEIFIDCGAYDGDTIKLFIDALEKQNGDKKYKKIYALEPNSQGFSELRKNCAALDNVFLINKGAWFEETKLKFLSGGKLRSSLIDDAVKSRSSLIDDAGEDSIYVTTIDKVLSGDEVTFIKMDIEGAEYEALKGAENAIKRYSPKLAICIYHKNEDLITIPRYLSEINPNYKFYLRAHESKSGEVVLYCLN